MMAFEMIEKYRIYHCESGDIKKTDNIEEGSWLFETDTRNRYFFNGTTWVPFSDTISQIPTDEKSITNLVTVDDTAGGTLIVSASNDRIRLIIQNQDTQPVLLSFGEDTSTTSFSLVLSGASGVRTGDGGSFTTEAWKGQLKGLAETGSTIVSVFEEVV